MMFFLPKFSLAEYVYTYTPLCKLGIPNNTHPNIPLCCVHSACTVQHFNFLIQGGIDGTGIHAQNWNISSELLAFCSTKRILSESRFHLRFQPWGQLSAVANGQGFAISRKRKPWFLWEPLLPLLCLIVRVSLWQQHSQKQIIAASPPKNKKIPWRDIVNCFEYWCEVVRTKQSWWGTPAPQTPSRIETNLHSVNNRNWN